MSTHLILFGPSTAGKTSLMLGLTGYESEYRFTLDRTWTTRPRRFGEGNDENIFATREEFERKRPEFLFPFQTYPTYEYGIEKPKPLHTREARMRILMPVFAKKFRELVDEPTVFCAILPFHDDPESVFRNREPHLDTEDMKARLDRYYTDKEEAEDAADICFQNSIGLDKAVERLGATVIQHLQDK